MLSPFESILTKHLPPEFIPAIILSDKFSSPFEDSPMTRKHFNALA